MIENGNVTCDRCKTLVVGAKPPLEGMTAGYYHGWFDFCRPGETDICDSCMWSDPKYIEKFGVIASNASDYGVSASKRITPETPIGSI